MNKYIIPAVPANDEVLAQLQAAGMVVSPEMPTIYAFLAALHGPDTHIIQVNARQLHIMTVAPDQFFSDIPEIINSMPGVIYPSEWMQQAAIFPAIDWHQFNARLVKTGAVQFTPKSKSVVDSAIMRTGGVAATEQRSDEDPLEM